MFQRGGWQLGGRTHKNVGLVAAFMLFFFGYSTGHAIELKSYATITAGNNSPSEVNVADAVKLAVDNDTATQLYVQGSPDISDPTKNWVQFDFSGTVQLNSFRLLTNSSDRLDKARVYLSASPYPDQTDAALIKTFGTSDSLKDNDTFRVSIAPTAIGRYLIFLNDSVSTANERYAFKIREIYIDGQYQSSEPVVLTDKTSITLANGFNNAPGTQIPLEIRVFDPPNGAITTITGNNNATFTLKDNGDNTATLVLAQALTKGLHTVTITAKDQDGNQGSKEILIDLPFAVDDNIASFGTATQGTPKTSDQDPRAAIDNDTATIQRSWCAKEHNWWQLEMPKQTTIQQIDMLLSSSRNTANGAVYLLNEPFRPFDTTQAQLTSSNKVAEFIHGTSLLSYKFAGNTNRYILIKGNGEECLSLAEVSVFGKLSETLQFIGDYDNELISASAVINTTVLTVKTHYFQKNNVTYSLSGSVPFTVNSTTGAISVSSSLQSDTLYDFDVTASDGTNSTTTVVKLRTTKASALTDALTSGDASGVLIDDIYEAILSGITPTSSVIDSTTTASTQDLFDVITKLKNGTFTVPLELCENSSWHSSDCEKDYPEFYMFWNVAYNWAKKSFETLDKNNTKIFQNPSDSNKLLRLLVLLGDKLRQDVVFPMDILTTDKNVFLRSLFADHLVYNSRDFAPVPNNLGTFSRTDFSNITRTAKTINLVSRKPFRSAGVYALPGQTVTVTRKDSTPGSAKIFVNSLRKEAMHTFDEKDYMRPAYPQSAAISVEPGQTISFTSVYGGPIQVAFSTNDDLIELDFQNIALHPYWNGPEDTVAFTNAVVKGEFDWAEVATPLYELHSRNFEMRNTLNEWTGGVEEVAKLTMEYTYKHIYTFGAYGDATFVSNTVNDYYSLIDIPSDISNFASAKGLKLIPYDIVQHLNADQPWAGYGTAGNPIDRYGNFNPLSHVDLHETGHNVELRTLFSGFPLHAVTDLNPFYAQSMFNLARGKNEHECWELNFELVFNRIQSGFGNPVKSTIFQPASGVAGAAEEYLGSVSIIQILMAAQDAGVVQNGWYIMPRLKLLGVAFKEAIDSNSETNWTATKNALGFGTYTLAEAKSISDDDWLLIAFSVATERDLRAFLAVYGHQFSQKAKDQVATLGYPEMPLRFYVSSNTGFCELGQNGDLLDKPWLPIDGVTQWPAAVDTDGDGYWDDLDAFPYDPNEWSDADRDGVGDNRDAFPSDSSESLDTDGDRTGNNRDTDDDNDGYIDADEIDIGSDPLNPESKPRVSKTDNALSCGPLLGTPNSILGTNEKALAIPADLLDRGWSGSLSEASVADIERNFTAARTLDSSVLPAFKTLSFPSAFKALVCADGTESCPESDKVEKWFTLSIQARGLYLANMERIARGLPPFEGVSTDVAALAQFYAEAVATEGKLDHNLQVTVDGTPTSTPWERLAAKTSVSASSEFYGYAENLAYTRGSTVNTIPIAHAIYSWIYDDSSSNWGHRNFHLSILNDNSGDADGEGLVGFGVAVKTVTLSDQTTNEETYVVFNAYDPGSNWNRAGMALSCLEADLSSTDTLEPVVNVPANINVSAVDQNGTPATNADIASFLASATANDAVDGSVTVTNNAPSTFPIGVTSVTFSATDSAGNTGTGSATVTVSDTTAPVITLLGEASLRLSAGDTYTDAGATASDNVDGDLTSLIVQSGTVDTSSPGTYTVSFEVTDNAGNRSTASRRVDVDAAPDADSDGVSDSLDQCSGTQAGSAVNGEGCSNSQLGELDSDNDGLSDLEELEAGTNPNDSDSDGDGKSDSDDDLPLDPIEDTDTDGDGIGDKGDAGDDPGVGIRLSDVSTPKTCDFDGPVTETALFLSSAPGQAIDKQLNFTLEGCGTTVKIEALFGQPLPTGSVPYKVSSTGVWTPIPGAVVNGNSVTYSITDNGPLDENDQPGIIFDPVTVVVAPSSTPVPALPLWCLWLLAGLTGVYGATRLRNASLR